MKYYEPIWAYIIYMVNADGQSIGVFACHILSLCGKRWSRGIEELETEKAES